MLSIHLQEIFKARQIDKPYSFLVKVGISPQSASKIISGNLRIFRLDHIEILCEALHCEPNDLLTFKPNIDSSIPKNHPLYNLISNDEDLKWNETLKTVPLSQLKELSKQITNQTKDEIEL